MTTDIIRIRVQQSIVKFSFLCQHFSFFVLFYATHLTLTFHPTQPITDEQIKVLKVLRRKLRNKASAQRSRDQDKERLKAMEIEFLTKAVSP